MQVSALALFVRSTLCSPRPLAKRAVLLCPWAQGLLPTFALRCELHQRRVKCRGGDFSSNLPFRPHALVIPRSSNVGALADRCAFFPDAEPLGCEHKSGCVRELRRCHGEALYEATKVSTASAWARRFRDNFSVSHATT